MFNDDFYPTPPQVIESMIGGEALQGKKVLEPSAGSGQLAEALQQAGAVVSVCENDKYLKKILQTNFAFIAEDFLAVTSDQVSHIDLIVMNPPFSRGSEHITHAYNIAPPGCKVIALCNSSSLSNTYSKSREQLAELVNMYGNAQELGECFTTAERTTNVKVVLIRLQKPGENNNEFEGFFMDDEPEEAGEIGLMSYNVIRDLVNRYVKSVQIFDEQLETAVRLSEMTANFYGGELGYQVTRDGKPMQRNEFKKGMQKSGWNWIFKKLDMAKYATRGLREDINKFVETQEQIPFTMKNIYRMLEVVHGTQGARMDKAILEVFDKVTDYHHDNRKGLEGWKTNSHYLLTQRFIMPRIVKMGWEGKIESNWSSSNFEMIDDLIKALCYVTGQDYTKKISLEGFIDYPYKLKKDGEYIKEDSYGVIKSRRVEEMEHRAKELGAEVVHDVLQWGKWWEWDFFRIRCYKKGTVHFEFKDEKVWQQFNARVAKLKGYPLPEKKEQTKYQNKQTGRKAPKPMYRKGSSKPKAKPVILSTIEI